jgi:hypothetical protein
MVKQFYFLVQPLHFGRIDHHQVVFYINKEMLLLFNTRVKWN